MLNKWVVIRALSFGALAFFLIALIDGRVDFKDFIAVGLFILAVVSEFIYRKRNKTAQ